VRRIKRHDSRVLFRYEKLNGYQVRYTRRVCAFFNSDEEEYCVLIPFMKDGFNANPGESGPASYCESESIRGKPNEFLCR